MSNSLLQGNNFNDWYQKHLDKFFENQKDLRSYTRPNGQILVMILGDEAPIEVTRADKYVVPTELINLLNGSQLVEEAYCQMTSDHQIQKPHGFTLKIELDPEEIGDEADCWTEIRLRQINGKEINYCDNDLDDLFQYQCGYCDQVYSQPDPRYIYQHSFNEDFDQTVSFCPDCYEQELLIPKAIKKPRFITITKNDQQFEEFQSTPIEKEKLQYSDGFSHLPQLQIGSFMDWIPFMTEPEFDCWASYSTFYINCNPNSQHYGKIMVTVVDDHGRQAFDIHYQNLDDLLKEILQWIKLVPSQFKSAQEYLSFNNDLFENKKDHYQLDLRLEQEGTQVIQEEFLNSRVEDKHDFKDLFESAIKNNLLKADEEDKLTYGFVLERKDLKFIQSEEFTPVFNKYRVQRYQEKCDQLQKYHHDSLRSFTIYYREKAKFGYYWG